MEVVRGVLEGSRAGPSHLVLASVNQDPVSVCSVYVSPSSLSWPDLTLRTQLTSGALRPGPAHLLHLSLSVKVRSTVCLDCSIACFEHSRTADGTREGDSL